MILCTVKARVHLGQSGGYHNSGNFCDNLINANFASRFANVMIFLVHNNYKKLLFHSIR